MFKNFGKKTKFFVVGTLVVLVLGGIAAPLSTAEASATFRTINVNGNVFQIIATRGALVGNARGTAQGIVGNNTRTFGIRVWVEHSNLAGLEWASTAAVTNSGATPRAYNTRLTSPERNSGRRNSLFRTHFQQQQIASGAWTTTRTTQSTSGW